MDFSPANPIVKLCVQSLALEGQDQAEAAGRTALQAWNEATHDFERFIAACFVARYQVEIPEKLEWLQTALQCALQTDNIAAMGVLPTLYTDISRCYDTLGDPDNARKYGVLSASLKDKIDDEGPFYHGTGADLNVGDLLTAGYTSNYDTAVVMNHIYFTALVSGAGLAAELAKGDAPPRIYVVEPTGSFENDPNVTDKKFPGNLTRSYRTQAPLRVVGEITEWQRLSPDALRNWRERLAKAQGQIIN